ncbi:MAG: hypothetical protein COZ06_29770 [Armatimonadetes bacterium CG_4_10_14_3_um_filter_66_18]|nr:hypothetical protein [Armatimonadota bacterium]PIX40961.1 MAG: hypothetical protein COZ57_24670 [Armatimonadetes bacterium CG_4_8_14_3_um_filter_66_20]PIY39318.1 MAG: hypothetical protein COZ06_29770 [Armatimonadetes bacterium CG_4_10_14_3_um_filter_66_18]PJB63222.1 MAG: hypothetical protein CO096_22980 [Armatimonadetes bacterium CG_4_9_14_3_um_filter_66_14]NCQ33089.1 hypothetical protein [Armatimonadota bacterium]
MANDTLTGELEPITMASTKKQMLAAYNELFEKLEEKREAELKPEERIVERQAEEVLGVAESLSLEGIGREVGNLRSEIGATLVALSDKLEEAVGKYVQTTRAVQVREKQLAEIYDIEKAASSLTALLEAQKQKRDEFDAERARRREESEVELAERRDELEAEIASMQEEWDREKALHAALAKERDEAEKKKRERDAEEYKYTVEREKRVLKEEFEYEKAKLEREAQLQREQLEGDLNTREKALAEREAELEQLRARAESFPEELSTAVDSAIAETRERLAADAETRQELLKRELEGEQRVLQSRLESLQQVVQEQAAQIDRLTKQLENSYGQVQDIAVKAIEGSSNLKSLVQSQALAAQRQRAKADGED